MHTILPAEPVNDFYQLFANHDIWQLHLADYSENNRAAWLGTPCSLIIQTFRSEEGVKAALAALNPDIYAWGYNPRQHRFITNAILSESLTVFGQVANNHLASARYALRSDWGIRPWQTLFKKEGEHLAIDVTTGPRELLGDKLAGHGCLLVTVRYRRLTEPEQVVRFWLDDFVTVNGALLRKAFLRQHGNMEATYQRVRRKNDPAHLLAHVFEGFSDIPIGLKQILATVTDYNNASRLGLAKLVLTGTGVMARLESRITRVTPYAPLADLVRHFPSLAGCEDSRGIKYLQRFVGIFGGLDDILKRPCLDGCNGTLTAWRDAANDSIASGHHIAPMERQKAEHLFTTSGYRCSCRALAGQLLCDMVASNVWYSFWRSQDCSTVPAAIAAGMEEEADSERFYGISA